MRVASVLAALVASACVLTADAQPRRQSLVLHDPDRARAIPVELYFPASPHRCTRERSCPVAFISPGYGLPHTGYSFVAEPLTRTGHLVVAIRHDLPSDPALATTGNLFEARSPIWKRGADNLRFVRDVLSQAHPGHDWANLTLIGHSNGGDLSALALHQSPGLATTLITLDHRRHPLPRDPSIKVLSIRGSDFEADPGVLPDKQERARSGACITRIDPSRHNDMHDGGPTELKARISELIGNFLRNGGCS